MYPETPVMATRRIDSRLEQSLASVSEAYRDDKETRSARGSRIPLFFHLGDAILWGSDIPNTEAVASRAASGVSLKSFRSFTSNETDSSLLEPALSAKGYLESIPEQPSATAALILDLSVLESDFKELQASFRCARVFYAVKANPHPAVLSRLLALGSGFEISSLGELRLLQELGVPGSRIISSNPVKALDFIAAAHEAGVQCFVFDSRTEVEKLAQAAPGASLCVRLAVPNVGSDWPLDKKFGVEPEEALDVLEYAREKGLRPRGVTFHVGSQCRDLSGWTHAMRKVKQLWEECEHRGMGLEVLNVGGGVPIVYDNPDVPGVAAIAQMVLQARSALFPEAVETWVEPGRGIVGRAGTMLCSVIGTAQRNGTRWVYLNAGVFHGLAEALGGIRYRFLAEAEGPMEPCTLAGPSCDSLDVIAEGVPLPPVQFGQRIVIPACGAYTTVYSSEFNGLPGPTTLIVDGPLRG